MSGDRLWLLFGYSDDPAICECSECTEERERD